MAQTGARWHSFGRYLGHLARPGDDPVKGVLEDRRS
jgi:hypothetical protein